VDGVGRGLLCAILQPGHKAGGSLQARQLLPDTMWVLCAAGSCEAICYWSSAVVTLRRWIRLVCFIKSGFLGLFRFFLSTFFPCFISTRNCSWRFLYHGGSPPSKPLHWERSFPLWGLSVFFVFTFVFFKSRLKSIKRQSLWRKICKATKLLRKIFDTIIQQVLVFSFSFPNTEWLQ